MQALLRQIDQELIQLLGKRMSLLSEFSPASLESYSSNLDPYLTQANVPESVWRTLVESCAAALAPRVTSPNIQPRRITVVGGRGRMGRFFTQWLLAAGHDVNILEQDNWDQAELILDRADLVLICVPINCTTEVVSDIAQFLTPTMALTDITSIKAPIVQTMLERHNGPVMGLHPMFGPSVSCFRQQKVVVCPGRGDNAFQWLLDMITREGGQLIVCPPQDHDQIMVAVQAIRHFATFSLGVFLAEEGIDTHRSLELSSPAYRLEVDLMNRLFAQSAPLAIDIMLATQARRDAIARLLTTYQRLAQSAAQNDRNSLIREFTRTQNFWRPEIDWASQNGAQTIGALKSPSQLCKGQQDKYAFANQR